MRAFLAIAAFVCLAFSGCSTSGGEGLTAKDAVAPLKAAAADWASDATFMGMFGTEHPPTNATTESGGSALMQALLQVSDKAIGDGRGTWGGVFYSSSKGGMAFFVTGSGAAPVMTQNFTQPGMMGNVTIDTSASEARWTVDSTAAISALRAENATLDGALVANAASATVYYQLRILDEAGWQIAGQAGNVSFVGQVDAATGAVSKVVVSTVKLPPIDFGTPPVTVGPLPPPMHQTGATTASADPLNLAMMPPCSSPSAQCVLIPFNLTQPATFNGTLSWGTPTNDYDFYVLDSTGAQVVQGVNQATEAPGGPQLGSGVLEPGPYTVQIVPWSVVQDSWTFDATFSPA